MHTDKVVVDSINRSLSERFRVLDGRPIYRLVWGPEQEETRCGTFTDWYGSILIRQEYKAVRRVKKYWYLEGAYWILEKLVFVQGQQALKEIVEELVEARNGSYEPIYVFQDKDKKPLPVNWTVVEFVLHALHNPTKLSPSDIRDLEIAQEQSELKYFEEELSKDERSPLFVWENSAFVSTNQLKFKQEYIEKTGPLVLADRRV